MFRLYVAALFLSCAALLAADKPEKNETLAGTWLVSAGMEGKMSSLPRAWSSKLVVTGDSFTLTKFLGLAKELKGKIAHDPAASPKTIDLDIAELSLGEEAAGMKIPECKILGIYKVEGDRLTVCLDRQASGKRPTAFSSADGKLLLELRKAPANFSDFPDEVTVRVNAPDGKPAAGVVVTGFMSKMQTKDKKAEWTYQRPAKTATDGTVKLKYETLRNGSIVARDAEGKRMAVVLMSPSAIVKDRGEIAVTLQPECQVSGTITCDELTKLGKPVGWANVYMMRDGMRLGFADTNDGKFSLVLPPGKYTLNTYGTGLRDRYVDIVVKDGQAEQTLDPIALKASKLVLMEGQPAPEFAGVVGWKGKKVSLAELKGKVVLLEFWGYWCGPCIQFMPVMIELHEKYADKGLAIVGIHLDSGGEVDTEAKLDERIAGFEKKFWKDKKLPFPTAMVSGKREGEKLATLGVPEQYGVMSYPTTIVIGRSGKIVGRFRGRDFQSASKEIEKLLSEK